MGTGIWDELSLTGVGLELHEKGVGISLVNVWKENLEARGSVGEGAGSAITPAEPGELGLKNLWVLDPLFTTGTNKRKGDQDILSGGYILDRDGKVLDRCGWRMNEGGDGFDEALD